MKRLPTTIIVLTIVLGALAPSGDEGISQIEIFAIGLSLTGLCLLMWRAPGKQAIDPSTVIFGLALAAAIPQFFLTDPVILTRDLAGFTVFFLSLLAGICIPEQDRHRVVILIIIVCVIGTSRDMLADYIG